jgi:hypothetical protein
MGDDLMVMGVLSQMDVERTMASDATRVQAQGAPPAINQACSARHEAASATARSALGKSRA